jgi:hypothetical protein
VCDNPAGEGKTANLFYSVEMYEREVILGSDDGKISVLSEDLYLEKQWTAHKAS